MQRQIAAPNLFPFLVVAQVPAPQELLLSPGKFSSLWVNIADGIITVGRDAPLAANAVQQWQVDEHLPSRTSPRSYQ